VRIDFGKRFPMLIPMKLPKITDSALTILPKGIKIVAILRVRYFFF
jgi:hypothetical protein